MSFVELLLIAVGLSMDAFAVSISNGLCMKKASLKCMLAFGLWFGLFQAIMPLLGYLLGFAFADIIQAWDHWIAFILLGLIGANMIREGLSKEEPTCEEAVSLRIKKMLPLAVATSIDALAIGVSFAFLQVSILPAALCIGLTTFLFSAAGVKIGHLFGARFKSCSELIGGALLILIGLKILIEHLFF